MITCALCKTDPRGEQSHIIPAFALKWLKKTSATGFIRNAVEINRRAQDGPKHPLLCERCEDRFSIYEGAFAKDIFYPFVEDKTRAIRYDNNCLKFSVSLLWRALHELWIEEPILGEPLQPEFQRRLNEPYRVWADFLLDKVPHPGGFTVNVLPVDDVVSATFPTSKGLSQYCTRALDIDLVSSSRCG